MDDSLPKELDYFDTSNSRPKTATPIERNTEKHKSPAAPKAAETSLWEGLGGEAGVSDSSSAVPSGASLLSFAQPSTAPTNASRGSISGSSFLGQSKSTLPAITAPQKRHKHDRKRAKIAPEPSVLDSVDYWIQFDDDDPDSKPGESFEIDFSKRNTDARNFTKPTGRLNPLPVTPGLGTGLYTSSIFKDDDFVDDSALDNALSEDEDFIESMNLGDQLSMIDSQPPSEVPPREGLYSTPLSWERPQPGLRMNPLFAIGSPMLDAEQRRLLAIALNTGKSSILGPGYTFGSGSDLDSEFSPDLGNLGSNVATTSLSQISKYSDPTMPPPPSKEARSTAGRDADAHSQDSNLRRSSTGLSEKSKDKGKLGDRTAHNDIEKKYRTNLKDRIAELRDAIPSLKSLADEGGEDDDGDGQGRGAPKVSKGTVLTKATEYINQLERKNRAIMREHQELARRLQAFEQLLNATARQPFPMPIYSRTMFDPRGFC